MGGKKSTPAPPPPPSPTFSSPWRTVHWGRKQEELQYVKNYCPQHPNVTRLRVLLYGPVGAGKSSLVNSVSNTLRERMTTSAHVGPIQGGAHSVTKKYETHKIKKAPGEFYNFVFNDIMGLEEGGGQGVSVQDIKLAMMGHVKEGYKFNPVSPLTPGNAGYNPCPTPDDKVHILVWVGSGNAGNIKVVDKIKEVREAAVDLGIPQIVVITKFDEYCGETKKNLQNIYKSKNVKKKMSDLCMELGIPMNIILPVKNYCEEISNDPDVDVLLLNALRLIIDLGDDFLDKL